MNRDVNSEPGVDLGRYNDVLQRIVNEEPITEDDFHHHFAHQNHAPRDGVAVGERAHDFTVVDHRGEPRSFDELFGPNGLLLVFVRSAHWCGYCRNQLGELNYAVDEIARAGVGLAVIAPDDPAKLADFVEAYSIRYPLLADVDGSVIRAYGLLNPNIPQGQAVQGSNIPFPGHFLIGPDRTIIAKAFTGDLRRRFSGTTLVARHLAPPADDRAVVGGDETCRVAVSLSSAHLFGGQTIGLRMDFTLAPGWHVYGPGVPPNYQPLAVTFDGREFLEGVDLEFPAPDVLEFTATGERLAVYSGGFRVDGVVRLGWRPLSSTYHIKGVEHLGALRYEPGPCRLVGRVRYQACTDDVCAPPTGFTFELPFTVHEDVRTAKGEVAPWTELADHS